MNTNARSLEWHEVTSGFNILTARQLVAMDAMERHQDIRADIRWLNADEQPLALIFFSHRWRTLDHPDPEGSDLRGIQRFLARIAAAIEALMVGRTQRLEFLGSLMAEGNLQAEEIARRVVGFGPFADCSAAMAGSEAKDAVSAAFRALEGDSAAFRRWLLDRIGVWLDYVCMPQRPLEPFDESEFRQALETLDSLVMSSTVVALREPSDEYATRGWCVSEFFLASGRSFNRGLFIDLARMERSEGVVVEPGPVTKTRAGTVAAGVMAESYSLDAAALRQASDDWSTFEGAFIEVVPPGAWAEYRSLQGSTFYPSGVDPNPFRRALDAVSSIEQMLIERWLMSDRDHEIDLAAEVARFLGHQGIQCTETADLAYLGLLLCKHGWIAAFRPLFEQSLRRYVSSVPIVRQTERSPSLHVLLTPLPPQLRARFNDVQPATAATWYSRLSSGGGRDLREQDAVDALRSGLEVNPPEFRFVESDGEVRM